MRNVWAIFKVDLRHLMNNVIAAIVVVGLVLVPPMYAWFTTLGFWDPYSNTGNLNVAVANDDAGYRSDLLPVKVDAGEQIISKLRANDQFHWEFVGSDEAVDGVKSGRYYAAIVIPENFSQDLLTVFSNDAKNPEIVYYTNEKENAIAPRITDTGASTLQQQIDETFAATIADVALETTSNLSNYISGEGIATYGGMLKQRLDSTVSMLNDGALQTGTFAGIVGSVASLVEDAGNILSEIANADDGAASMVGEAKDSLASAGDALSQATSLLNSEIDDLIAKVDSLEKDTGVPTPEDIQQAKATLEKLRSDYNEQVKAAADAVEGDLDSVLSGAGRIGDKLKDAAASLSSQAGTAAAQLHDIQDALSTASSMLSDSASHLSEINSQLDEALSTGQLDEVRKIIGDDPEKLASFLTAPTELVKHAVYEMPNNGSAMSPFYSSLSLWIGSIFLVALTSPFVSKKRQATLKDPKPWQMYLGRYCVFCMLALMQAVVLCLGNVFFLGVHCEHFWLYLLACCVTAIVFSNVVYTLTVSFGNIGKAIAIVLLVMQLAGAGGIFPVQMSAQFFQVIYPYLPFTHSMEAFESAMAGIYGMQYWLSIGQLTALIAPMLLLGLVLRRPIIKMNDYINMKLDETKLV